jgi:hypothetical protein
MRVRDYDAYVAQTSHAEEQLRWAELANRDESHAVAQQRRDFVPIPSQRDLIAAFIRSTTQGVAPERGNSVAARAWRAFCGWL